MQYSSILRLTFASCICCLFPLLGSAQFGLSGFLRSNGDSFGDTPVAAAHEDGFEIAADYWFRLPTKRIEFLPTIHYGNHSGSAVLTGPADQSLFGGYRLHEIGFEFKTNFYLFDFGTDCDCPTWGKQGPALHKGFFVQIAPGINWVNVNGSATAADDSAIMDYSLSRFIPSLGVSLGIDFGISNLVTVTPLVGYRYYFSGDAGWDEPLASSESAFKDGLSQSERLAHFSFGLRLGIRMDEKRY